MTKKVVAMAAAIAGGALFADIPESVDVLVLGGTVRGVSAAVAAKEAGADVYLVAPRPFLGEDIAGKLRLKKPAGEMGPICSAIYDPKGHEGSYAFGDTTPAQAKKALDRALLDAKVPFVTWTIGAEYVRDADGKIAGAKVVNRNGEKTIRAKCVIDARDRLGEIAKGEYPFVRYIISGEAPKSPKVKATAVSDAIEIKEGSRGPFQSKNQPKKIAARLWRCEMTLPMEDGSARSLAAAEQLARDLTWTPTQIDSADSIIFGSDAYDAAAEERLGRSQGAMAAERAKSAEIPVIADEKSGDQKGRDIRKIQVKQLEYAGHQKTRKKRNRNRKQRTHGKHLLPYIVLPKEETSPDLTSRCGRPFGQYLFKFCEAVPTAPSSPPRE